MTLIIDGNNTDEYIILFCAFRYALGRQTYVVSTVADILEASWNTLSSSQRKKFKKEIQEAIDNEWAGSKYIDIPVWEHILTLCD